MENKKIPSKIEGNIKNLTGAGKGRPKGSLNKTTTLLKDAILKAAELAGNNVGDNQGIVSYLSHQAEENPTAFMGLLGKVLPMQIAGDSENPLVINVVVGGDDNS